MLDCVTSPSVCTVLFHTGEARVHTEVQAGPLYRVAGSLLSISCNVSGFASDNATKDIEFRVKKPANPTLELNIISTRDKGFSYAMYTVRVRSKEITLTHVTPNSVLFEIHRLEKGDEGEYDCSVVNSEQTYDGTYSAVTTVKVIDNSLSVSSTASTSLSYTEGDALALTCRASSNSAQHTHLSLVWYLHNDGRDNARPIISLDREFTLSPGPGFEGRHQAGLIRLDKTGEATYKLNMAQLELSDQGRIYCQAQEWIQDPDHSWYTIAQKDVVPDTSSLVVRISAQPEILQEGQELSLSCNVDSQNLEERFFSVAWLRGNSELARIGPTGILSVGPEYSGRVKEGELRAARIGDGDYRLILQPVRTEDQGEYLCRAWLQDRGQDGAFTQQATQDSSSQLVSISSTESGLSVELQNSVGVNEGYRLELTCKVHRVNGQLSVTWQRKSASTAASAFASVISLSQEGVTEKAGEFVSRAVRATRPAIDTFTLELDGVTPSDSGVYQCVVSEWKINSKTNSQSRDATVTVAPTDSFVKVKLISRDSSVTVGDNVELMCWVSGPRLPITLTWSLQRPYASTQDSILTVYSDGAISWFGDQQRYQLKVENKENGVFYYLLMNSASRREAGIYQCWVSVFLEKVHKKLPPSNQLGVLVQDPVSDLVLTTTPASTINITADIEIKCSVISKPSASSRYAVTWLLQQQAGNKTIVSSDQDALVTVAPREQLSHGQRISTKRTKGPSFELSIRQARLSDNGSYVCEVVEWLQDPHGDWYQLSPVSKTTELTVIEPETNLSILKEEKSLNMSRSQDLPIPCHITDQSSSESEFQVTWFWQKETEAERRPIFTAYRNSTLQDRLGKGDQLRFRRPLRDQFSLTVIQPSPEESGLYFCEVEEWLPSPSHGWRKLAVEKSGYLTVNVYAEDMWMGILIAIVICSLLVVFLLVLKICRSNVSGGNKSAQNLWAEPEQYTLKTKPSADD
uniref:Immunoglobulin superfamily, member 3-like n=1 Tax=Cyclopterus lumpus TaxID=8103 RepID=A0A8C2ZTK8_CYCLU